MIAYFLYNYAISDFATVELWSIS